jgi:ribose transport system permease protein
VKVPLLQAGPVTAAERAQRWQRLARFRSLRDYGIVASFVAIFIVLSVASPVFLTSRNLLNVLDESAQVGIMACAETLVFIAGGFDLSIGAIYAVAGIVAVKLSLGHMPTPAALAVGVLVGVLIGAVNGLLTTVGRINAFIATIATQFIFYGVALVMTGGFLVTATAASFAVLGGGFSWGLTYQVIAWFAFAAVCGFLLSRTTFGRYAYAVGGNSEAARLAGVHVKLIRGATFAISGIAAALAGVLDVSRVSSAEPTAAMGIELTVIAAVVIGGTSIYGGAGAIWRTLLGVLLLTLIGDGFNLLNISATYQQIFQGGVILIAVGVDAWSRSSA